MAAENFKVKRGLEVGTGSTITSGGVNITGIITAVQFKGDGSGLTGVVGSGSGVVIKDEGSTVGTAGTINFVGSDVSAAISEGTATVTVGVSTANVVTDSLNVSGISTFNALVKLPDSTNNQTGRLMFGDGTDLQIFHTGSVGEIGNFAGNLNIKSNGFRVFNGAANQSYIIADQNSSVSIAFSGTNKLSTSGIGVTVYGQLDTTTLNVSGISTFTNEIVIRDDSPTITFDQTSGNLNTNQYRIKQASGELVVQVSHNNGASYTNGVSIGGIGNIFIPDNDKVFFGTNDDAYIQHDNSNLNVINTTGNIDVTGNVVLNNDLKVGTGATLAPNGNANFSGIITATSFSGLLVGNVQGNATSASSCSGNAATATVATNVTVTANNSTDETVYPVFVDGATETQGAETDTGLNYNPSTGNLSATKFTGDGSGLTSIPSAQLNGALPALDGSALTNITGSGSGVIIRHDGNVVGTASSINFSTNLDVTPISAGIVTVTASGGSGGIVGIDTTGTSVFNEIVVGSAVTVNSTGISATGVGITADTLRSNGQLQVGGAIYGTSRILLSGGDGGDTDYYSGGTSYSEHIFRLLQSGSSITRFRINRYGVDVSGIATATSFSGSGIGLTSLNADNLGSGTIPNGRFPATLPAVSGANLTNLPAANLTGTIANGRFPATLPVVSGVNLTALNASEITSGTLPIARITDGAVTFAKMQDVGTGVLIGRNDSGSGVMETLTAAEARTLLNVADGATAGITTAASNVQVTWSVGANGSSAYRFTGPGNDGSDDNPDLYLVRGQRYRFINNSGGSHPFEIRSSAGGSSYDTGVTNNGASSGNIDFNVQHDAPTRLYYQCTSHGGMVGNIYITGGASWQTTDVNTSTTEEIFTNLNVGIGTNNPLSALTLAKDENPTLTFLDYTNNAQSQILGSTGGQLVFTTDINSVNANSDFIFRADSVSNEIVRFKDSGGITFNGDTADANALDDYEEGSWTPTVLSEGNIGTPQYTCTYTKIGRLVTINADIHQLSDTTSNTNIKIGGLPYVPSGTSANWSAVCHGERYSGGDIIVAYIVYNSGSWGINFRFGVPTNHYSYVQHSDISDDGSDNNLRFTLTYEIA